jgi:hypothetical protein
MRQLSERWQRMSALFAFAFKYSDFLAYGGVMFRTNFGTKLHREAGDCAIAT